MWVKLFTCSDNCVLNQTVGRARGHVTIQPFFFIPQPVKQITPQTVELCPPSTLTYLELGLVDLVVFALNEEAMKVCWSSVLDEGRRMLSRSLGGRGCATSG